MDDLELIKKQISGSHSVMRVAIGSHAKPMAHAMRCLGKRASASWVSSQGSVQTVKRANILEQIETWVVAFVDAENFAGLEVFLNEIELITRRAKARAINRGKAAPGAALSRADIEKAVVEVRGVLKGLETRLDLDSVLKRRAVRKK